MIIPLFLVIAGTYSYFSVLNTLGEVPVYNTQLYNLAKQKGVTINILPYEYGKILVYLIMFGVYSFLFFILSNYGLHLVTDKIVFYKKLAVILLIEYVIFFFVNALDPFGGWYMRFILD
ncbi:MAG: hypothetical protein QM738_03675 [Ferruginibacter sp.]